MKISELGTWTASVVRRAAWAVGLDVTVRRRGPFPPLPPDFDASAAETYGRVRPFTMTSPERVYSLCNAIEYVVRNGIPGDIVECGVWRGGSMMAVALTLQRLGDAQRDLYLFDTYEGMTAPTTKDRTLWGVPAEQEWRHQAGDAPMNAWCNASVEDVAANLRSTGYPPDRLHFVRGRVEDTIPEQAPRAIAVLRLDTDWYESTKHELEHLFPRLVPGGVIVIDDYGHWEGARAAVDEYVARHRLALLLSRIDYTGRIAVKPR